MLIDDDYAEKLARLLLDGKLILFAGAGLSLQAKNPADATVRLPLWWDLAEKVAKSRNVNLADFNGDILDLFDSIDQTRSRRDLEDAVRDQIPAHEFEPAETHTALAKLPWKRIYTTNYDDLLQRALKERTIIKNERDFELLNRKDEDRPKLVHLHGTLEEMHTLTGEDYQTWQDHHPRAVNRFVTDGMENSILFVGYSNSDPHFKHQILPLIKKLKTERGHVNFSWMWKATEAQISLFGQRDRVQVHPIDEDQEWHHNMEFLFDAFDALKASDGAASRRKTRSRRFERKRDAQEPIFIHGYKLFYHRDSRSISR